MKFKELEFKKSILNWEDAISVGDGKLGALIYGGGPLRISVDRVDIWDNRPNEVTLEADFNYARLVELAKNPTEENWAEHKRLFDAIDAQKPYPSKITAGRLELDFGKTCDDISSRLDMYDAVAYVSIPDNIELSLFSSAVRHIGVAKIKGEYKLNIHIPDYISGDESGFCKPNTGAGFGAAVDNWCLQYPKAKVVRDGDFTYYYQLSRTEFSYATVVMEKAMDDGTTELYYTVATSDDGADVVACAKRELTEAFEIGYESLLREHKTWWHKYHKKSELTIPDKKIQRLYDIYNYHFACCSRKGFFPMALQGVWTADNDALPPWKGDYHFDTNVQITYQPFIKANRLREGEAYVDYLFNMRPTYNKFAKEFFGVNGYLIPSTSSISGKPIGGWAMYALSPTMTVWAIQVLDDYYLYTGNKKLLRSRIYPIFKEVGNALYSLMRKKNGKLYLPLSSSPEIFDNKRESYLKPNSNFDLSLLIYLYTRLRDFSKELGYNSQKYEKILSMLDPLALDEEGTLMIDSTQPLPESHRHFSHVMAIYPLHLVSYNTEEGRRIIDASIAQLEKYGTYRWCGFSFGMMAQIYAMAKRGDDAYRQLKIFEDCFVGENGFHQNGDFKRKINVVFKNKTFTLESEFSFNDALQEMLMQEHEGVLELLPAIPKGWKSLSFKKFRSHEGLLVSLKLSRGRIKSLSFESKRDLRVKLKDNYSLSELLGMESNDNVISLDIKKGKTKLI